MSETLTLLSKVLPQLAIIAVLCGFIGWSLRGRPAKTAPAKSSTPIADKGQQDRAKNLEAALEKSKAAHKSLKAELENLQSGSVSKATFEQVTSELAAARSALDTVTKRISTLETDLKKAQDTAKQLNVRLNDGEKAQKDRSFALENELSKTREQLAILQNRPDDSAELQAEIERLRESVAVSSRFAGEVRKREAAAIEALERAEAKLADLSDPSRPAPVSKKVGPVVESDRIAAAKAEVIRLNEMNKLKDAVATVVAEEEPAVIVIEETIVIVEELPAVLEEAPAVAEEGPVIDEEVPESPKTPSAERFPLG